MRKSQVTVDIKTKTAARLPVAEVALADFDEEGTEEVTSLITVLLPFDDCLSTDFNYAIIDPQTGWQTCVYESLEEGRRRHDVGQFWYVKNDAS